MMNTDDILEELAQKLSALIGNRNLRVDRETELYYDLNLSGWEFDNFLTWINTRYGLDVTDWQSKKFAPGEGYSLLQLATALKISRPYRSITIGDILDRIRRANPNPDSRTADTGAEF